MTKDEISLLADALFAMEAAKKLIDAAIEGKPLESFWVQQFYCSERAVDGELMGACVESHLDYLEKLYGATRKSV